MTLSLAVAFFLVVSASAEAAPQAQLKKDEADTFGHMVTISGDCTKLIYAGRPIDGCKNIMVNMNYGTGVSAYWFVTDQTVLSFAGDGSRRIEQGQDVVIQLIERVVLAARTNDSTVDDATEDDAVGLCRFGDPTKQGTTIECSAHTQAGLYEATFVTDGKPPKLEEFQINR